MSQTEMINKLEEICMDITYGGFDDVRGMAYELNALIGELKLSLEPSAFEGFKEEEDPC